MGNMSPIVAELERMYGEVVRKWFDAGDVQTQMLQDAPMMTVASRGRKATVTGWYVEAVWHDATEDILGVLAGSVSTKQQVRRAEIVIASELLADPVAVVAEIARQSLAHSRPNLRTGDGFYYKREWELAAGAVGCRAKVNPEQPGKGWSLWTPGSDFRKWALNTLNFEPFDVERESQNGNKAGSRMKKWSCGCTTVRCAVKLEAFCESCSKVFAWAEKEPEPTWTDNGRRAPRKTRS